MGDRFWGTTIPPPLSDTHHPSPASGVGQGWDHLLVEELQRLNVGPVRHAENSILAADLRVLPELLDQLLRCADQCATTGDVAAQLLTFLLNGRFVLADHH